jgi:hypothetical protein
MKKVIIVPCDVCNIKILKALPEDALIPKKLVKYLTDVSDFEKMFNEGSLDLDRCYIKFLNENQY